jgi:hypothetical protein
MAIGNDTPLILATVQAITVRSAFNTIQSSFVTLSMTICEADGRTAGRQAAMARSRASWTAGGSPKLRASSARSPASRRSAAGPACAGSAACQLQTAELSASTVSSNPSRQPLPGATLA